MSNYCDFYEYRSGSRHWCLRKDKEISRDTYLEFCSYASSSKKCPLNKGEDSSCFITTACIKAKNLPDDCYELETMRKFRDGYVRSLPNGDAVIKEYYDIAPKIVEAIGKEPNGDEIFKDLYTKLVVKCVRYIEKNQNEEAYDVYQNTVSRLKQEYVLK